MDEVRVPLEALKGRGAATWLAHRFERDARQVFDDGWDTLDEGLAQPREPLRTEVIWEDARSIISSNESPDVYFDRSINPYRGCEHGCIFIGGWKFTAFGLRWPRAQGYPRRRSALATNRPLRWVTRVRGDAASPAGTQA